MLTAMDAGTAPDDVGDAPNGGGGAPNGAQGTPNVEQTEPEPAPHEDHMDEPAEVMEAEFTERKEMAHLKIPTNSNKFHRFPINPTIPTAQGGPPTAARPRRKPTKAYPYDLAPKNSAKNGVSQSRKLSEHRPFIICKRIGEARRQSDARSDESRGRRECF